MSTMTAQAGLPFGRPLTVEDLEAMPDDGHRYELIDGTLIVTPAPSWPHQGVQVRLTTWLYDRCPRDLRVIAAPFEVQLAMALDPEAMRAFFEKISPLSNAKRMTKPMFIVHGRNDPRVPVFETEQVVATLKKQGTPVWSLPGMGTGSPYGAVERIF